MCQTKKKTPYLNQTKTPGLYQTSKMIQDGQKPNVLHQLYSTANPPGHRPVELPKQGNPLLALRVSYVLCIGRQKLAADTLCANLWFPTLLCQGGQ